MIKYVALDLDGTLLDDTKQIRQANLQKICKLMDRGYIFILISGRNPSQIKKYADQIGLVNGNSGYIISSNGFCITDMSKGNSTFFDVLSAEDSFNLASAYNIYNITIVTEEDDFYLNHRATAVNYIINFLRKKILHKHGTVCNQQYIASMKMQIIRLLIHGVNELEKLSKLSDLYKNYEADVIDGSHVEIRQKNVSKWNALSFVMTQNGIQNDEIAYFGDDMNDYDCFRHLQNTFAMQNAVDSLKRLSRYVVPSNNEDGISQGLQILEELNHVV